MSKFVKCKACGKEIAKGAKCPECGQDSRNFFMKHKVLTSILALIIIGVIAGVAGGAGDDVTSVDPTDEVSDGSNTQQEERNFEVGQTAESKENYRITVNKLENYESSNEFIKPAEGNKYVLAEVTVENLTESTDIVVSSILCFNLLSLDGHKYDIALTDAGSQLDGTVAPGRKLTGNIVYEVPVDLNEAELEVNLDVFTGKAIYFKGEIK